MANCEKLISKRIGQAIYRYLMIEENDRILVAVSGGKDSLTLLYDLNRRRKSFPVRFDILAVHLDNDFSESHAEYMEQLFIEWGVPYRIVRLPVLKRLKQGKKMSCFWCATQRRTELMKIAEETGCNKIALGHHMDDIIETFFMNICYQGETATMLPVLRYHNFPHTIIRPLALVYESLIKRFVKEKNFVTTTCTCPCGDNSKRLDVRKAISFLARRNKSLRLMIFKAMHNVNIPYLKPEERKDTP